VSIKSGNKSSASKTAMTKKGRVSKMDMRTKSHQKVMNTHNHRKGQ
jgi:hypothetical protein